MKAKFALAMLGLTLCLATSNLVLAAEPTALRVVVVETQNVDAYIKELAKGQALLKKLQSPATIRVWRARFAGPNAGAIIVSVEYPNLAAVASDDAKIAASAEYSAWLKGLDKLRKVVSDSLYQELKP